MKDLKALSQIRLHLSNEVLQDVLKETSASALWLKLEQLLMTKSLPNKLHLKQRLFNLKMIEGGSLAEHIYTFKELINNLENMDVQYEDEDLALFLLSSLPESYNHFRDTIIYSRDTLVLDKVYTALDSKEKIKHVTGTCISHLPQSIHLLKGLCIVGSRGLLRSFGFTSKIQTLEDKDEHEEEMLCYVEM